MHRTTLLPLFLALSCSPAAVEIAPGASEEGADSGDTDDTDDTDEPDDSGAETDPCDEVEIPRVAINELVASNVQGATDADGDAPDWLELINLEDTPVDLEGWGLSDDEDEPHRWLLPARELGPGEVLMIWASGKDQTGEALHTSFSLGMDEPLLLTEPGGCPADLLVHDFLPRDVSLGRTPEDPQVWGYFMEPTPGEPNSTEWRPGFAETPAIDPPPGFGSAELEVSLSTSEDGATLRWALGGELPGDDDTLYEGPFVVDAGNELTVLRARAWVDGLWPSLPATASYSGNPAILADGLKIVSLTVDPDDLWDEETGIYAFGPPDYTPSYPYFGANFWEDWERDLHIEVWEPDGSLVVAQDAGVKIHGGYTRAFNQKSFRVIARSGYGSSSLDYRFFPDESQDEWKVMVLEGVGDWCPTHTENAFVDRVFRDAEGQRYDSVETQAWEPTVVYLNGDFWGLYAFREKLDEHYIAERHGADPDNLDRIECTADGSDDWWRVSQGDWEAFDELEAFVASNDLADPAAWETFKTMVDIDNLASTVLAEGYGANSDWWNNNLKMWREREADGQWRWMVFDIGHGWNSPGYDHIGVSVGWNGKGLPIAQALRNEEFRVLLANQGSDFLNTSLDSDVALVTFDEMHARIQPVIAEQYALWCGHPESLWQSKVAQARTFVAQRDEALWGQLERHLALDGTTELSLEAEPAGSGRFALTVVEVEAPFTGTFFQGIPVTVTALPAEGYSFAGWAEEGLGEEARVELVLDGPRSLTAVFE